MQHRNEGELCIDRSPSVYWPLVMLVPCKRVPRAARASTPQSTCAKEPRVVKHQSSGCTDLPLNSVERSYIGNPNSKRWVTRSGSQVTHQLSVREKPRSRVPMRVEWTTRSGVTQIIRATGRIWPTRVTFRGELHA